MVTGTRVLPESLPTCSIAETTDMPEITFPKTTCFPSTAKVQKNKQHCVRLKKKDKSNIA